MRYWKSVIAGVLCAVLAMSSAGVSGWSCVGDGVLRAYAAETAKVPGEETAEEAAEELTLTEETAEKSVEETTGESSEERTEVAAASADGAAEDTAEEISEEDSAGENTEDTAGRLAQASAQEDTVGGSAQTSAEEASEEDADEESEEESADETTEEVTESVEITGELGSTAGSGEDPDELFADYVDRQFYGKFLLFASSYGERRFRNYEYKLFMYQSLKDFILEVAENGGVTSIVFDMSTVPEGYFAFTGLNSNVENVSADLSAAFNSRFAMSEILNTLLADCPYELYWFNKTTSNAMKWSYIYSYSKRSDGSVTRATVRSLTVRFQVSNGYQADDYSSDEPAVTTDVSRVSEAVERAGSIVSQYESLSDLEKLTAYKDAICDLTSYNRSAVSRYYTGGYGDPWQLVYVFDSDESTNVVCEGYTKAFQYLCEMSYFEEDTQSYIVTGTLQGDQSDPEGHMWNVVRWQEGNYLVDVTNSDAGNLGSNGALFMVTDIGDASGYAVEIFGVTLTYVYDEDTGKMYGESIRTLVSDVREIIPSYAVTWQNEDGTVLETDTVSEEEIPQYSGETPQKEATEEYLYVFDHWNPVPEEVTSDQTYTAVYEEILRLSETESGKRYLLDPDRYATSCFCTVGVETYYFDKDGYSVTGWKKIEGNWYYFDTAGVEVTGWLYLSGKWYYLDSEGVMLTGFCEIGTVTYYFTASGDMKTGWVLIDGDWYYFAGSGKMMTGWVKSGNGWYYMDSTGKMMTGWIQIGGSWYYMNSSGKMMTGWLKSGSGWYYLGSSGAMQVGWIKVGGSWYYTDASGKMVTGSRQIGKKTYYFNQSGVCLNP